MTQLTMSIRRGAMQKSSRGSGRRICDFERLLHSEAFPLAPWVLPTHELVSGSRFDPREPVPKGEAQTRLGGNDMPYCTACGKLIEGAASSYCRACGSRQSADVPPTMRRTGKPPDGRKCPFCRQ